MQANAGQVVFLDLYQTLLDVRLSVDNPNHEIEGWNAFAEALLKYSLADFERLPKLIKSV